MCLTLVCQGSSRGHASPPPPRNILKSRVSEMALPAFWQNILDLTLSTLNTCIVQTDIIIKVTICPAAGQNHQLLHLMALE